MPRLFYSPPVRTATFVVAANNSSAKSKAQADYVCDGVDDQVEIQAAIDALPAGGGTVLFSEGTFIIYNYILLENRSNIKLTGIGSGSILKMRNQIVVDVTEDALAGSHTIVVSDASEWKVGYQFTVRDDDEEGKYSYKITNIEGNTLTFDGTSGIVGEGLEIGLTAIKNAKAMQCFALIFIKDGCHHITCENLAADLNKENYTEWTVFPCSYEQFFRNEGLDNTYITVKDCYAYNSYGIAIDFHGSKYLIVSHNYVKNCRYGIGEETNPEYQLIEGNNFNGGGILISVANYLQITNNIITDSVEAGIYVTSNSSNGNIVISGNIVLGSLHTGIHVRGVSVASSSGVIITGNNVQESIAKFGIIADNIKDVVISDNVINRNAGAGILLMGCTYVIISGNTVDDNNTLDQSTRSGDGIGLWNSGSEILISNNRVHNGSATGHQKYAVRVEEAISSVVIKNNIFTDNDTEAILDFSEQAKIYTPHSDHFQDCLALSTTAVHAAITGTGAEQEITTAITNPDVPRNISITNSANSTGDVTITGIDAKGNSITEDITIVTGGTAYGDKAFATVSKITIPAGVANPDTIEVGISDKLGLSNIVYETSDVYKVKVNNADATGQFDMAADVDVTNGTLDMSSLTAGAIGAGDDITIYYRSNLNIIS